MPDLSSLALGVVLAIIILFLGLFIISAVSTVSEKNFYVFSYTTASNTSSGNLTAGAVERSVTVGTLGTAIYGSTPSRSLFIKIDNKNTTVAATVTAYYNGTSVGSYSATNNSVTNHTFSITSLIAGKYNVTTIESGVATGNVFVNQTDITYESGRTTTGMDFGSTYSSLVASVSTIFDVLILVVIIVSLGVAIAVLRGFGSGGTAPTTTI